MTDADIHSRVHIDRAGGTITFERVSAALNYDPLTGEFHWRESLSNVAPAGRRAGSRHSRGYIHIQIDGRKYKAHRLAWLLIYGEWPTGFIDHINGDPSDNRIANLRTATNRQNQANTKRRVDNRSGYRGVSWHSGLGKWVATISRKDGRKMLGAFKEPAAAYRVYREAALAEFGEFARL